MESFLWITENVHEQTSHSLSAEHQNTPNKLFICVGTTKVNDS